MKLLLILVVLYVLICCIKRSKSQGICPDGSTSTGFQTCFTDADCSIGATDNICALGRCCPSCRKQERENPPPNGVRTVCEPRGRKWLAKQCLPTMSSTYCWCLTEFGQEIPGTRGYNSKDCEFERRNFQGGGNRTCPNNLPGLPVPVSCAATSQCPPGFVCNSSIRACCPRSSTRTCSRTGDQPLTSPSTCTNDNQCPAGFSCDLTIGGCCRGSSPSRICRNNQPPLSFPSTCTLDSQCGSTSYECDARISGCCQRQARMCRNSSSSPLASPRSCTFDGQCPNGYVCDLSINGCCRAQQQQVCRDGKVALALRCTSDTQCPNNYQCQNDISACCIRNTQPSVCPDGSFALTQPQRCTIDTQCPSNYQCQSGVNACCRRTSNTCPGQTQDIGPCVNGICPTGFQCIQSLNRCCSTVAQSLQCPPGETVLGTPNSYRTCTPNVAPSCPSPYNCRYSPALNAYFCCSTAEPSLCPAGMSIYISPSGSTVDCSSGRTCPFGSTCNYNPVTGLRLCCRTNTTGTDECPGTSVASIDPSTGQPRTCGFPGQSCPFGFSCQYLATSRRYFCCSSGNSTANDQCPSTGSTPYTNPITRLIQTCTMGVSSSCPTGHSCQYSTNGRQICCTTQTSSTGNCPTGSMPFRFPGTTTAMPCTGPYDTSCPRDYTCQTDGRTTGYSCCTQASQVDPCPGSSTAYRVRGAAQICVRRPNSNMCPSGYTCEDTGRSGLQRYACCSNSSFGNTCSSFQACESMVRRNICVCPAGKRCEGVGPADQSAYCKDVRCLNGLDAGQFCGSLGSTRYYYDSFDRSCKSFSYRGCGGNSNNFRTFSECQTTCSFN